MASVVGSGQTIVFCEGKLDSLILHHLVSDGQVQIQMAGGKRGIRAYIEGRLSGYREGEQPNYLAFLDRDFDVQPQEQPRLTRLRGEKPLFLCHRGAIENYMIDRDLIRQYWEEGQRGPAWAYGPAPFEGEIQACIDESARQLADYQAIRWALASLKPGPRWPELDTTWTKDGSGDIPSSLAYHNCLAQAAQLVDTFGAQSQGIHQDRLKECAEAYRERFRDERFFHECRYLVWFHGKDHLALLCHELADNFPRAHYAAWATEHIDVDKHPDLQELVRRIQGNPKENPE